MPALCPNIYSLHLQLHSSPANRFICTIFLDSMLLLFSYIVAFNTSQPHGLQHARLPCYSPSPRVYPSSWIGDAIQPAHPLSLSCPLPSTFPRIRVFSSESAICIRGQIIGASASASVLPMSIQGWFPLRLTVLISLLSKGLSVSSLL